MYMLSGKHLTKWPISSSPVICLSPVCNYLGKRSHVSWGKDGRKINSKTFDHVPISFLKRTQTSLHLSSGITNQLKSIHWLRGHNLLLLPTKISPLCLFWNFSVYMKPEKNLIVGADMVLENPKRNHYLQLQPLITVSLAHSFPCGIFNRKKSFWEKERSISNSFWLHPCLSQKTGLFLWGFWTCNRHPDLSTTYSMMEVPFRL